ncbi:MAG TPA: diadenylate cyclase CdaA [Rectinemataceae bacterium]|nr:diadenylate cyclase CdaA [Rectinemataceae bacterium]
MDLNVVVSFFTTYVRPVLDVLLLAYLIYNTYQILLKTQAIQLVKGILLLTGIYAVAFFLQLSTVTWILGIVAPGLVIGLAIIFQPELRKIFMHLGQGRLFRTSRQPRASQIEASVTACEILAQTKRGALIVFSRNVGLKEIIDKGIKLDAILTTSLLVTIFAHDNPLHDGAAIIQEARLSAAACFLPLSNQQDIKKSFGSRHRAALGITEESDAVVLVVSEETGALSLAYDSKLYYGLSGEQLRARLTRLLEGDAMESTEEEKHYEA